MKRLPILLLSLILALTVAACGTTPPGPPESDELPVYQNTTQELTLPELEYNDNTTEHITAFNYNAATSPLQQAVTLATTNPVTTTTATTRTTTTTTPQLQAPITIQINRNALASQFASTQVVQPAHMVDSIGRESNRIFTGIAIRDILTQNGVNLNAIPAGATLVVRAADGHNLTLSHAEFMAPTSLLAWHEVRDGTATDLSRPRLVFPSGLSGRFVQQVTTLELLP